MIKQEFLERIKALPDVFMLASLVQFKYVQTINFAASTPIVTGKQIGRASCRERVYVLV